MQKKVQCKKCKQHREVSMRYVEGKLRRLSRQGNLWEGRTCPTCITNLATRTALKIREKQGAKAEESLDIVSVYHENRTCRKCKGKLTTDRWFQCSQCYTIPNCDDSLIYNGEPDSRSNNRLDTF